MSGVDTSMISKDKSNKYSRPSRRRRRSGTPFRASSVHSSSSFSDNSTIDASSYHVNNNNNDNNDDSYTNKIYHAYDVYIVSNQCITLISDLPLFERVLTMMQDLIMDNEDDSDSSMGDSLSSTLSTVRSSFYNTRSSASSSSSVSSFSTSSSASSSSTTSSSTSRNSEIDPRDMPSASNNEITIDSQCGNYVNNDPCDIPKVTRGRKRQRSII